MQFWLRNKGKSDVALAALNKYIKAVHRITLLPHKLKAKKCMVKVAAVSKLGYNFGNDFPKRRTKRENKYIS